MEFTFTTQDFDHLRQLVTANTGIVLADGKRDMVYSRLSRRIRTLGLKDFKAYCTLLEAGNAAEQEHFVNAITTNLTSFFRENHHFEFLANSLLPRLMKEKSQNRRLRIWSAGCSTGEEPYSIAMVLRETLASAGWDARLLATDIDSNVLSTAQRGVYNAERTQGISTQRLQRWFRKGTGSNAGMMRVMPELQGLITFRQLNLMESWPHRGPLDIIFCRNVVIYFDKPTQKRLFERFADLLPCGGHLFIGHSESLFNLTERFELLGNTVYQKRL